MGKSALRLDPISSGSVLHMSLLCFGWRGKRSKVSASSKLSGEVYVDVHAQ